MLRCESQEPKTSIHEQLDRRDIAHEDGETTVYKKMFDVWLKNVEAFVAELYKKRNHNAFPV